MAHNDVDRLPLHVRSDLEHLIARYLDHVFPALALAVMYRGERVLEAAWGRIDPESRKVPVTTDSLFDLASVTKLFVEAAFLSLVSEGHVALDAPLVNIVPEFGEGGLRPVDGGQDPHSKEHLPIPDEMRGQTFDPADVTFRHLLTHTSGLAPWRDVYRAAGPPPAPPDRPEPVPRKVRWSSALKALCTYPFVGQPGEVVRYSDLGLMLLGEAATRLYNMSGQLETVIQERVIEPLALESLTYNPVRNGRNREQIPPTEFDSNWRCRRCWGEVHDENACGVGGVAGHAGLFGRASDVATFGHAWLERDTRLGIAPELMDDATREQAASDANRHGFGWMVKSVEGSAAGDVFSPDSYGHTGFTGTSLWIDPRRRLVVACLTNRVYMGREKSGIHDFRRAVHDLLANGLDMQ